MPPFVDEDVKENYRQLRAERGCSWEQLAKEMQSTDPNLAAWFRQQAGAEKPKRAGKSADAQETRA